MTRPKHARRNKAPIRLERTGLLEQVVFGMTSALIVLSVLVPSEGAVRGTGALLAAAWMVLLVVVHFWLWQQRETAPTRWGWPDWIVLGLAVWVTISALVMAWQGNPRSTLNAAWQWAAIFASYWVCRQVFTRPSHMRTVIAIMIGICVGLAAHGLYQFFIGMPHNITHYYQSTEEEKQRILLESGVDPTAQSPLRRNFEDRLRSTEPTATFGLANSLAGVLATWLIFSLAAQFEASGKASLLVRIALAIASLTILATLVLTKSRSAWVAFAVGLVALTIIYRRRLRRQWYIIPAAASLLALTIVIGILSGALDRQVLTEARLSVEYRLQYWRAALQMTAAHPLFGSGPGNFQEYYSQFKSPVASETIADPHNFLLEVAATAGIPAALLLVVLIVVWMRSLRKNRVNAKADNDVSASQVNAAKPTILYVGALIGGGLAIVYGWVMDTPVETDPWFGIPILLSVTIPVALLVWAILHRSGFSDSSLQLPVAPVVIAAMVMMVNLLAAGGISYVAVSSSLWLFIAFVFNLRQQGRSISPQYYFATGLAVSGLLLVVFLLTGYAPVLKSRSLMAAAATAMQQRGQFDALREARSAAMAATAADRWSPEPWQLLSQIDLQRALQQQQMAFDRFEDDVAEARRRNRRSQALEVSIGIQYLVAYQRGGFAKGLRESLGALQKAAELYPNNNYIHGQLAWVAHLAEQSDLAGRHAATALQLDALNPHWEQQLRQRRIQDFRPADQLPASEPHPAEVDAEQMVTWLRNRYGRPQP